MLGSKYPLLHPKHKIHTIIIYLFLLYLFSIFTWDLLTLTESTLTGFADRLSAIIYDQPLTDTTDTDLSQITIQSNSDLLVLLRSPHGQKIGLSHDDIKYSELPNSSITELKLYKETTDQTQSQYIRYLTSTQLPIGNYQLILSSKKTGTYPLTIQLTDRSGIYSKEFSQNITLNAHQTTTYFLKFHKDLVQRSQFKQKLSLSRLLLTPFTKTYLALKSVSE